MSLHPAPGRRPAETLRRIAGQALDLLGGASAEQLVAWAAATFRGRLAIASSMQDGVLAHLASQVEPRPDVLFLDTGYHFPETIQTRRAVQDRYRLNVVDVRPGQTPAEQDASHGVRLFERDPDLCCLLRKTVPLDATLTRYEALITGLRRADSTTRQQTPVIVFDERRGLVTVNPIAGWPDEQVADYIAAHDIVVNPLLREGYASVGCAPCTRPVVDGADSRSGRWAGSAKTECGIHSWLLSTAGPDSHHRPTAR